MSAVRIEESVQIERPVAEVFAYVSDPTHLPEWTAVVTDVRTDTPSPSAAGTRFTSPRSSWVPNGRRPAK